MAARLGKLGDAVRVAATNQLAALLDAHWPGAVLLARLRSAPAGTLTALMNLDRSTSERMDTHPDGEIFRSFPRAGRINAGQVLTEWGDAREVFDHPHATRIPARVWVRAGWRCWQRGCHRASRWRRATG